MAGSSGCSYSMDAHTYATLCSRYYSASARAPASPRPDLLITPPAKWPEPLHTSAELRVFLHDLNVTRVELVTPPKVPSDIAAIDAATRGGEHSDFLTRAANFRDQLGWPIVSGFALFQVKDEDAYVAEVRRWNARDGRWLYVLPGAANGGMVLCESNLASALLDTQ